MAIFQRFEVYRALPFTKGINFKSGKLNEQNEQSLRKSVEKNRYKMHQENNQHFIVHDILWIESQWCSSTKYMYVF